jgi:hypothetical protein
MKIHNYRKAIFAAVSQLEIARAQGISDPLKIHPYSTTTEDLHVSLSVQEVSPCLRQVFSQAMWQYPNNQEIVFDYLQPNISYAQAIDYDCGNTQTLPQLSSTSTPETYFIASSTYTTLESIKDLIITTSYSAPTSTIHIANSSYELLSEITLPNQIKAIDATQKKIFVAINAPVNQFQIINTEDPKHPTIESIATLPGVTGSFPGAISISYFNKKIYIGVHRTAGREFHVYDVSSPSPLWLGSIELNHNINAIAIQEPYAYLATSGNTKDLIILDIHDPKAISIASTLDLPGNEDALSLFLTGNSLFMGRKKSLRNSEPDFIRIGIENPHEPTIVQSHAFKKDILGIRVIGNTTYLVTQDTLASLLVVNIENTDQVIVKHTVSLPGTAYNLDISSSTLSVQSSTALTTFKLLP